MAKKRPWPTASSVKHLFNTLGRSKDGQLDASEIQHALRYFGHYVCRAQTMELIARVDEDGDLNVGYEEYHDLMHKIATDWERDQPHEDFAFSFRSGPLARRAHGRRLPRFVPPSLRRLRALRPLGPLPPRRLREGGVVGPSPAVVVSQ